MKQWRNQIAAAGLSVLAGMGLILPGSALEAAEPKSGEAPANADLASSPTWKHLSSNWNDAAQIAAGARGAYPFSQDEKKAILDELQKIEADIAALRSAGLLTEPEAALLTKELPNLIQGVQKMRPVELQNATCYRPMGLPALSSYTQRVVDRLPLLEKLAAQKKLQPQVVSKVIESMRSDLAGLSYPPALQNASDEQRKQAKQVQEQAKKQIDKLQATLKQQTGDLEQSSQWKKITEAWKEAAPLARTHKSTTKQRDDAREKLNSAMAAACELADRGLLSTAEAELLVADAESMNREVYRDPPIDSMVKCYDMAYMPPAKASLDRLSKRLPLLTQVVRAGTVHRIAVEKIIPTIEDDLKVIADEQQLKQLTPTDKATAVNTRRSAEAQLAALKELLK